MKRHPLLEFTDSYGKRPAPPQLADIKLTRTESKYFYEGVDWILSELELIRDRNLHTFGETDMVYRTLDAVLNNEWRRLAKFYAFSLFMDIPPGVPEKRLPLEAKGMLDDV